jgi:hypothetical protein
MFTLSYLKSKLISHWMHFKLLMLRIEVSYFLFFKFYYRIIVVLGGCIMTFSKVLTMCLKYTPSMILNFIPFPLLRSFSRSHFSIFIHEYTIFPPYSPPIPFSLFSPPTGSNPQIGPVLPSCSSFFKKRHFCLFKVAIQGESKYG